MNVILFFGQISLEHGYKPTTKAGITKMATKPVGAANKVCTMCV